MNKTVKTAIIISVALIACCSCSKGDPRKRGVEAGKAACECYKLNDSKEIESCLSKIENENQEILTDSAYLNAVDEQLLQCISDGVIDIENPIKIVKDTATKKD
ncbi:MAG: hypothetical protein J5848_02605 [Bacteroidales bacterium]|nr:hypothetical protein [Bacteroidales bacterium]